MKYLIRICIAVVLISVANLTKAKAQQKDKQGLKVGNETYYSADTSMLRGDIINPRTAQSVGIPKILSRIPSKTSEIILETYSNDKESMNLKYDIRNYLSKQGFTNIKTNVQPFYGEDFTFRQCDVAIMNMAGAIVLFIPPCEKAYKH